MSSNIHGINSLRNEENRNRGNSNFRPAMLMSSEESLSNIREETFPHFIKQMCCPHITIKSIILWVSILDIIIYIITLFFGIQKSATELLAPTYKTLDNFGMKIPYKIYKGQIHRLILFGILHANLIHISMMLYHYAYYLHILQYL